MRKVLVLTVLFALVVPAQIAAGATTSTRATAPLFVGGGTFVSNGTFFPGTAVYQDGAYYGAPYEIAKGTDVELTNVDEGSVANGHAIRSFKRRRNGRPLFASARVDQPGESTIMITSHLKPGVYPYFCLQHSGMLGRLEITRP
jgi:plastocyanin